MKKTNFFEIADVNMEIMPKRNLEEAMIIVINEMIEYFRLIEKEKKEMKRGIGGVEMLTDMLTQGSIKMNLYLKIKEAIQNPDTPYKITVKNCYKNE